MSASQSSRFVRLLDRSDPLARILDLADDAIISVDAQHQIVLFNQGAERMFGYSSEEVFSQPLDILLPPQVAELHRRHIEAFDRSGITARRMGERREILARRKDGTEFPAEASISKVAVEGRLMFTVILRDVTQRTLADSRLKASLREKELLLEEVHHRVKNNLQVVSSLLGLQARSIADIPTRKKFQESQHRIQSMALLHETLYRSDDLERIDFADYSDRLAKQLLISYGASDRIRLITDLEVLRLDMNAAVPCGLIVNELISNSLKYGFPDGNSGEVHLDLHREPTGACLVVWDNGVGLPKGSDWRTAPSLGLRLVRTLSEQLGGSVEVDGRNGTCFTIRFPIGEE